MNPPIVEFEHFSFVLEGHMLLSDISLSIDPGEFVSIIGPNGAGKTTLLKCLERIHHTSHTGIRIAGKSLAAYSQRELARVVSYVPQADGVLPLFTVAEFIMMGRYPYLSPCTPPGKHDKAVVAEVLELTGTAQFSRRHLATLSGGERQRVFIAAALAQEARILLLDEPDVFLDPCHQSEIHGLLSRINRERGVTVLLITHDINLAALISGRILALKKGSPVYWGDPEGLMQEDVLFDIYGKPFVFVKHPSIGKNVVVTDAPC